ASDQYSLALTFCELTSGRLPFVGEIEEQLALRSKGEMALDFLPVSLRPAIRRALSPDDGMRFPSCKAFGEKAGRCVNEEGENKQGGEPKAALSGPAEAGVTREIRAITSGPCVETAGSALANLSEVILGITVVKGSIVNLFSDSIGALGF